MRTNIILVTGLLGAGKTSFINGLLEKAFEQKEKAVVIQRELGQGEAKHSNEDLKIITASKNEDITTDYLQGIIKEYLPDTLIIECNGFDKTQDIIDEIDKRPLRKISFLGNVINLIEANSFEIYFNNLNSIMLENILICDLIVLNHSNDIEKEKLENIKSTIRSINNNIKLLISLKVGENQLDVYEEKKIAKPGLYSNIMNKLIIFLVSVLVGFVFYFIRKGTSIPFIDYSKIQIFSTVFLSILIQAIPFILVGVVFSSIIQVFITSETISRFFPKSPGLGFIAALVSGVFLPVCDCAIVPVASRLIKKGIPVPIAITFMLAAPIVNPVTIASTFYAFPTQPSIALYRIYFGVTVAFFTGLAFYIFPEKDIFLADKNIINSCECGVCEDYSGSEQSFKKKFRAILTHSSLEFFQVGKFLIIGAFLSSIMQVLIPKELIFELGGTTLTSLIIMMLAAFVLSVCSTSDAFIARTFINQLPLRSVLGFMVIGPMIDIKNLSMLLGSFKKRFVIKLVAIIFFVAFIRLTI
ncbi:permease [Clostridium sp. YIM B02505]|uniref:Permease n=1 Tax=Clostridium yunnanense TaxID=2800325 RepID=A0ABS1ESP7_9CLOT|nr:permease [Clostridium yunnanense]MBK1812407.1 permease [Clostridium yunnanense]